MIIHAGNPIFISKRIGQNNKIFNLPKFKTLINLAPIKTSENFKDISKYYVVGGYFLKKTGLDELPQLILVLVGKMNLIGPRPVLDSQFSIIKYRSKTGINKLKTGITGYAQIFSTNRNVNEKNRLDYYYYKNKNFSLDLKIILFTVIDMIKRIL